MMANKTKRSFTRAKTYSILSNRIKESFYALNLKGDIKDWHIEYDRGERFIIKDFLKITFILFQPKEVVSRKETRVRLIKAMQDLFREDYLPESLPGDVNLNVGVLISKEEDSGICKSEVGITLTMATSVMDNVLERMNREVILSENSDLFEDVQ